MSAEVKITADNQQLVSKLDQAIAKLSQFEAKAKSSGSRASASLAAVSAKQTIRDIKDIKDPFSAGALSKIGMAGVGLFTVATAARTAAAYIKTLSEADYLSAEQRGQMGAVVSFFDDIKRGMAEQNAGIIAGIGDVFTGGAFTEAGKNAADLAKKEKTVNATVGRDKAKEEARQESLTDEEKLEEMVAKRAKLEHQMAKQTGDKKIETETKIWTLQRDILRMSESVSSKKQAAAEKEASETERRESAKATLSKDLEIAQAQKKGDTSKVQELQREKNIQQDATRIAAETGLAPDQAMMAAEALNPEVEERNASGRKKIKGYSGAQRAKNKFLDQRSFKQFFHPDSFFDKKDLTPRASKDFNDFFGKGKGKSGDGKHMTILERQLEALEKLTSY